jgi:hypothetical protein
VVDTLTGETEEAMAVTAIKKLDPDFNKVRTHPQSRPGFDLD